MPPHKNDKDSFSLESSKQPFWAMSTEETFHALSTGAEGLSGEVVALRRKVAGVNVITTRTSLTRTRIFLSQFTNPLIIILLVAAGITIVLGEWVDASVILGAVFANAFLGFWQESKAENALDVLKTYIRSRVRVRRRSARGIEMSASGGEGGEFEIDAADLVPGDIVRIRQGDRVPADARIFFVSDFSVDEAVLTGESLPVWKQVEPIEAGTALAERASMVFGGTLAVGGFADVVITAIGDRTEFGKIALLVGKKGSAPTPLQSSLARFVARAGAVLAVLVALLFGVGLFAGYDPFGMFLIAVAVAVSAVPEGLPIAFTVILAIGVERLAKKKGVVRKLLAAETMGSTSLILTDKTGTLTTARMELAHVLAFSARTHDFVGKSNEERDERARLLYRALVNTDVIVENPEDAVDAWRVVGRPLESALARGAAGEGVLLPAILAETPVRDLLPFSSVYKYSAVVVRDGKESRLILFGAPDVLLGFSDVDEQDRALIASTIDEHATRGERVLGVASRRVSEKYMIAESRASAVSSSEAQDPALAYTFEGLSFDGLISFRDPLRPSVAESIRRIGAAGVKTIIVTGDHKGTAEAVAREIGMVDGAGAVLTGDDLRYLSEEELENRAGDVRVYARVTPEQKVMIAQMYQKKGEVVAVTGDGVNDAPALEAADIGVAVGSGTDVAKSAADLVILDDNFETIVASIEEGRRILDNIRKVIVYLLSDSLDEMLLIGGSLLAGFALPLSALQILFVNFFSDSFPAIALAFDEGDDGLGAHARTLDRNLFDSQMRSLILIIGGITSLLLFGLYAVLLRAGFDAHLVRTFIFSAFGTYSLLLAFSVRSLRRSIFSFNPFGNLYLVGGVGIGLVLTASVIYVPFLSGVFGTVPLPPLWLAGVLVVGVINVLAVEFGKWIYRKKIA